MKYYSKEVVKRFIDSIIYKHLNKYIIREIVEDNRETEEQIINDIIYDLTEKYEIISPKYKDILRKLIAHELETNFQTIF